MATGSTFSPATPTKASRDHAPDDQDAGDSVGENIGGMYWAELLSSLNQSDVTISRRKENGFRVKCGLGEVCWRPLVTTHWPRLLNYSGVSVEGRYVRMFRMQCGSVHVLAILPC